MAWERRGKSGSYFYRSIRADDGRVQKQYFGKGELAQQEVQRLAEAAALRKAETVAIQKEQLATASAEHFTQELENVSTMLLEAALLAAGFWRGRDYRRWRRRRGAQG